MRAELKEMRQRLEEARADRDREEEAAQQQALAQSQN